MTELVVAIICAILALVSLIISIRQFQEKGFLFNNAYIWATKEERETMDKKPHYRQSAIAFAIIAAVFFVMALECIFMTLWLWLAVGALAIAVLVYAVVSSKA